MRIAFVGSRGIPAQYGGFEVFAERLSEWLVEHEYKVTVYTMAELASKDVALPVQRVFVKSSRFKSLTKLSLSAKSMLHAALRERPDIILLLGASGVPLMWLAKLRGIKVVFNPDGLEHQRQKWNWLGRFILKRLEAIGAKYADCVVVDSGAIGAYIDKTYGRPSVFIPYGAEINATGDDGSLVWEKAKARFGVEPGQYYIMVGRFVPENNFDMIIRAYIDSQSRHQLLIVSDALPSEFNGHSGIIYKGPVYDRAALAVLRRNAITYFHGHSVGGTNPSLLEAIACLNPVFAYDVPFNREVLGDAGHYFKDSAELATLIVQYERTGKHHDRNRLSRHYQRLLTDVYDWDKVCSAYGAVFSHVLGEDAKEDAVTIAAVYKKYQLVRQRERAQLSLRNARGPQEWWTAVCETAGCMGLVWVSLKTRHKDGRVDEEIWRTLRSKPNLSRIITVTIPLGKSEKGASQEFELAISADGSLEDANDRATLFGQLIDEQGVPAEWEGYTNPECKSGLKL